MQLTGTFIVWFERNQTFPEPKDVKNFDKNLQTTFDAFKKVLCEKISSLARYLRIITWLGEIVSCSWTYFFKVAQIVKWFSGENSTFVAFFEKSLNSKLINLLPTSIQLFAQAGPKDRPLGLGYWALRPSNSSNTNLNCGCTIWLDLPCNKKSSKQIQIENSIHPEYSIDS